MVATEQIRTAAPARHRFRAMGTEVEVIHATGRREPCLQAEAMVRDLEGRWSRFRPDSDLCRLNRATGSFTRRGCLRTRSSMVTQSHRSPSTAYVTRRRGEAPWPAGRSGKGSSIGFSSTTAPRSWSVWGVQ